MGMGTCAAQVYVIDSEDVRKLCPKEYRALMKAIKEEGTTLEKVAYTWDFECACPGWDIEKALTNLVYLFGENTGLSLCLCYYDPDKGDRYDTIDEAYWSVDGVYELTPAGKKYQDIIRRETYVIYG